MTELTFLITMGLLVGLNVFVLLLHQHERHKGMERELILIKAVKSETGMELKSIEDSPADMRKRMTIENDLADKAEKLEEWKAERVKREDDDKPVHVQ
jgi:hypothetical protein